MRVVVISLLVVCLLEIVGFGFYLVGWNAGIKEQYMMCESSGK